jgi:hypothetical protein
MADHYKIQYSYTKSENAGVSGTGYTNSLLTKVLAEACKPWHFICTTVPADESHKQQDGGVKLLYQWM